MKNPWQKIPLFRASAMFRSILSRLMFLRIISWSRGVAVSTAKDIKTAQRLLEEYRLKVETWKKELGQ